ncbi:hypothetical protein CPB84DRAFT_1684046 [Gymnopilus junonius]|uniref:Uncharacterized protein n=1 Tax=Gymnopilus junonius TaxID=109634 RepID=A0A9P5NIP0_GYMJU|nr:hypothetical protein CPB84DRAFT_1684046 [Gymnopilus junonius]
MYPATANEIIVDLYIVDSKGERRTVPFVHRIEMRGPKGEIVRFRSVFDDGAMVNMIDVKMWEKVKHHLTALASSSKVLRMANGQLVPSHGIWCGEVSVRGMAHAGAFEIFDSQGAWAVLFGKPLLWKFKMIHDYDTDEIMIKGKHVTMQNQYREPGGKLANLLAGLTCDIKQCLNKEFTPTSSPNLECPEVLKAQAMQRQTREEQVRWRADNGLPEKKMRAEQQLRKEIQIQRKKRRRRTKAVQGQPKEITCGENLGDDCKSPSRGVPAQIPCSEHNTEAETKFIKRSK